MDYVPENAEEPMPNGNEIRVIERDNQYHVEVIVDGQPLTPHVAPDLETAEAMALQFAGACRVMGRAMEIVPLPAARQCV